jgi:hypothetical protein
MKIRAAFVPLVVVLAGCDTHNPDQYITAPSNTSDFLTLSADAASVEANGVSTVTLRARIPSYSHQDKREVAFTASAGQLIGSGAPANAGTELKVIAVPEGDELIAQVLLRSTTTVETAVVRATAQKLVSEVRVAFTAPDASRYITIRIAPTAPADGATLTPIALSIDPTLAASRRTVTLEASKGRLSPNRVSFGIGESSATVFLESPIEAVSAFVTATIENTATTRASVTFEPALPASIVVNRDKISIQANHNQTVRVEAVLLRQPGKVTPGTAVTFRAVDDNGHGIGAFFSVQRSNADGIATASWDPVDPMFTGRVTISATVGSVSGSTDVTVTP